MRDTPSPLLALHGDAICDYLEEQEPKSDDTNMSDDLPDDWEPPF